MRWRLHQIDRDADLADEIRAHIELEIAQNIEAGMPLEEARHAAHRKFGNAALVKEEVWKMNHIGFLEILAGDLRYAVRILSRNPIFSAVAVLSLALGIGANTAIFSLIDAILLKTLPVHDAQHLLLFSRITPRGEGESFPYAQFEIFRQQPRILASIFAFAYRDLRVDIAGQPREATVQLASDQYFSALGVNTLAGRVLSPGDTGAVAVIGYGFWKRAFGLDPAVLGKTIDINKTPFMVVGIAPPGFFGVSLDYAVDLWTPLAAQPLVDGQSMLHNGGTNWLRIMARAMPGIPDTQAAAALNVVFQQYLKSAGNPTPAGQRLDLIPGGRPVSGARQILSRPLLILMVLVALVLLIACANLANLLLAKAAARQREITVRVAIGASRARVIQQLLTESVLLATIGGAAGVVFAKWGSAMLLSMAFRATAGPVPLPLAFALNFRVLGFTALVSILTGVLFGLAPALCATRIDLSSTLKESAGALMLANRRVRLDKILLAGELAMSLLLLIAAGLFVRSFQKLGQVDLGFNPNNVVQLKFNIFRAGYTNAQLEAMWDQILDRMQAHPGVQSASMSVPGMFSHSTWQTSLSTRGAARPDEQHLVYSIDVTPEFFGTLRIPVLRGRAIDPRDNEAGPHVAVINETAARRFFQTDPVGQRIALYGDPAMVEVVGIVKDTKYDNPLQSAPPIVYVPISQAKGPVHSFRVFEVRTSTDPAGAISGLRSAVQSIDPNLAFEVRTMDDLVDQSLTVQHLIARLTAFFGMLGLLLACVGVYGLMSYAVLQRTAEIGIRMALGARRSEVVWLILRQALPALLTGAAIGLTVAIALTRVLATQLFGLTPNDPLTLGMATVLLVSVAALAAYLPARRASRVDPLAALRYE